MCVCECSTIYDKYGVMLPEGGIQLPLSLPSTVEPDPDEWFVTVDKATMGSPRPGQWVPPPADVDKFQSMDREHAGSLGEIALRRKLEEVGSKVEEHCTMATLATRVKELIEDHYKKVIKYMAKKSPIIPRSFFQETMQAMYLPLNTGNPSKKNKLAAASPSSQSKRGSKQPASSPSIPPASKKPKKAAASPTPASPSLPTGSKQRKKPAAASPSSQPGRSQDNAASPRDKRSPEEVAATRERRKRKLANINAYKVVR